MRHSGLFNGSANNSVAMSSLLFLMLGVGLSLVARRASAQNVPPEVEIDETIHELMGQPHFPAYAFTKYHSNLTFTEESPRPMYAMGWTHVITRFLFNITYTFGDILPFGWFYNYCTITKNNGSFLYRLF